MGRTSKVPAKAKIKAVKEYLGGKASLRNLGDRHGVHHSSVEKWVTIYQSFGEKGLYDSSHNMKYPLELKKAAVYDYQNGNLSLLKVCQKYKIKTISQLQNWIKKHECGELK